jgi:hypothetical protein
MSYRDAKLSIPERVSDLVGQMTLDEKLDQISSCWMSDISKEGVERGEIIDISAKVRNPGKVSGEEVVQLYICDEYASSPRPIKELKGLSV